MRKQQHSTAYSTLMAAVISLLRAINLGAYNKISMEDLRKIYASLELGDPRTYVQSGNVVFETREKNLTKLVQKIEDAIERKLRIRPDVILRSAAEMRDVVARNPFAGRSG